MEGWKKNRTYQCPSAVVGIGATYLITGPRIYIHTYSSCKHRSVLFDSVVTYWTRAVPTCLRYSFVVFCCRVPAFDSVILLSVRDVGCVSTKSFCQLRNRYSLRNDAYRPHYCNRRSCSPTLLCFCRTVLDVLLAKCLPGTALALCVFKAPLPLDRHLVESNVR